MQTETLFINWTPFTWGFAFIAGLAFGWLLVRWAEAERLTHLFSLPLRAAGLLCFVAFAYGTAMFWASQILASMLEWQDVIARLVSRGIIQMVPFGGGASLGVYLSLRRRHNRKE